MKLEKTSRNRGRGQLSVLVATVMLSLGVLAETTLPWQFDASGRAARIVAPASVPANVSGEFETAFWDREESNAISVSSYPCGLSIIFR